MVSDVCVDVEIAETHTRDIHSYKTDHKTTSRPPLPFACTPRYGPLERTTELNILSACAVVNGDGPLLAQGRECAARQDVPSSSRVV